MCIAVSGKLIEQNGRRGKVDISGNILPVELGLIKARTGDFVLVHAGCAISVLPKDEKQELDDLFALLNEVMNEDH